MPRNIVICCDGTNNQFGPQNTNVVRLVQALDRTPGQQLLYYDPGVGTLPEPGSIAAVRAWIRKAIELAFGAGLVTNVLEAYTFLMDYWEPGDQVFLFGFSRGAYTIRVLAGMLHQIGLLPHGSSNLLPYAVRLFKSVREENERSAYWQLCNEFRWTFAKKVNGDDRHFPVHFLGLWDTVSSVGWVWEPKHFPFTQHNPSIDVICHAVSIDEHRAFYRTNLMKKYPRDGSQRFHERWFPGDHCDIGGGHSDGSLWRCAFQWMIDNARTAGLRFDENRLARVVEGAPSEPWAEPPHDLLKGLWRLAEYVPKAHWNADRKKWERRCNRSRRRGIHDGSQIDRAALHCIRKISLKYRPPNLPAEFFTQVEQLRTVPDYLEFHKINAISEG